jgi:ribosomal protein S12 methylthiotransferase accessory factor YcaO
VTAEVICEPLAAAPAVEIGTELEEDDMALSLHDAESDVLCPVVAAIVAVVDDTVIEPCIWG